MTFIELEGHIPKQIKYSSLIHSFELIAQKLSIHQHITIERSIEGGALMGYYGGYGGYGGSSFVLIVVLFILLIIIGASFYGTY